jgi:serine/threonine protein kinase
MVRRLAVIAGPDRGQVFPLPEGATVSVGRGQDALARLGDPHVSRIHCRIVRSGDRLVLSDAGSTAGTLVNGAHVTGEQPLSIGDVIQIGQTQLRVDEDAVPEMPTFAPPAPAAPAGAASSVVRLADLIGQTVGHYQVSAVRARGQTGLVFLAQDLESGQDVALKVLRPEFTQRSADVQRFLRAAQTVLPLRHPHLVPLRDVGQAGPCCWLAMDWIEGESLTDVIDRIGVAGMLDWRFAARVAVHLARALQFAHAHQVIHRNLTPRNVLVRFSDKTTLLGDLMLAKAVEGSLALDITRPGEVVGDIRYTSPERLLGNDAVDARSDIYSLGALVYALLTGRPPLAGPTLLETLALIRTGEPVRPKKYQLSIADLFEGVVLRMLAKRPEDRYQSADDLLVHLDRALLYQGVKVDAP